MTIFDIQKTDEFELLTKKELELKAIGIVKTELESGQINNLKLLSKLTRIKDFVESALTVLKPEIEKELNGQNHAAYNMKISHGNSGDRLNYKEDPVYNDLHEKLKAREELLKVAYKSKEPLYDSEGIEIPKVGLASHGKPFIKISY